MVTRRITLCSESLRSGKGVTSPNQQYSYDGAAVIELLKNNIAALKSDYVEIEAIGFGGRERLIEKVPKYIKNKLAEYRHRSEEVFIIVLLDSDSKNDIEILEEHRKLADEINGLIAEQYFNRVYIMYAVRAIEAWILSDEVRLNQHLGVTNKVKRENEPERISQPKQTVEHLFEQCGQKYTPQELVDLLPTLRVSELQRCKHFNELYECIERIAKAAI